LLSEQRIQAKAAPIEFARFRCNLTAKTTM
jgi:hypothetical protein